MTDLADDADARFPLLALAREHGREDAGYLVGHVAFDAAKSFVGFADVFVLGLAIDALFNDQPLALPFVPPAWIPQDTLGLLLFASALVAAVNVVTVVGGSLSDYCSAVYAQRLLHRLRVAAFDAAQRRDLAYFDERRTGDAMSALNDDVNQLEAFFSVFLGAAVWILVTLVAAVVYMAVLNWQLALFVLASAPVVAVLNYRYAGRLDPLKAAARRERGALNARLESTLDGVDVVKAYTAADRERDRVADASREYAEAEFESRRVAARQEPANRLVAGAWLLGTLALGVVWVVDGPPLFFSGTLTAGELVPFLFYMERVTLPLKNLAGVVDGYTSATAAAERVVGLTGGVDIDDDSETEAVTVEGRVAFEDVTFAYPDSDDPALDGVDFAVEAGETVGVVGSTGAGKSTVAKLLLGLYAPDDGEIRVDDRPVADLPGASLRDAIGYVDQDAFLFNGTVRHNVAYGADGDPGDEAVREAARTAGVHEEILALPDGYDTEVGDDGSRLSGGQRQRLAIARAVVGDPEILILDEATSSVDTETERRVQANLADVVADRTTFVVAHRLSTVRAADRILVVDDGEVVESGTHDELLDRGGQYADLWAVQVGNAAD